MALAVHGLTGNIQKVEELEQQVKAEHAENTALNGIWQPVARAALEIQKDNATEAIKLLEPAKAYEPGANGLWSIYMRGLAYLKTKNGRAAASEFQKILDHRGADLLSALYPVSHFRLAEAYTLMNDRARARKSYEDFFTLWKNADPNIPILKEAQEKYKALSTN